ncbi:hypothetical protein ACTID9_23740 [Brevibacillus fluminis]|uniref:hypothetical protein n=1 Tax=Brevibacillus fluminis TaxID=511487 RepID=UPI003F8938E1
MKREMTKTALCMLLCAMLLGAFGGFAQAAESETAAAVSIAKFALLEKKFDKTGSAEFKPDGTRDGHFQVSRYKSKTSSIVSDQGRLLLRLPRVASLIMWYFHHIIRPSRRCSLCVEI